MKCINSIWYAIGTKIVYEISEQSLWWNMVWTHLWIFLSMIGSILHIVISLDNTFNILIYIYFPFYSFSLSFSFTLSFYYFHHNHIFKLVSSIFIAAPPPPHKHAHHFLIQSSGILFPIFHCNTLSPLYHPI